VDDDTRDYLRAQVAAEVGLPQGWGDRLSGDSVAALRADASKLAKVLGIVESEPVERDERGRFAGGSMNQRIRRAARGGAIVVASRESEPPAVAAAVRDPNGPPTVQTEVAAQPLPHSAYALYDDV
jgi:hypothetical protein